MTRVESYLMEILRDARTFPREKVYVAEANPELFKYALCLSTLTMVRVEEEYAEGLKSVRLIGIEELGEKLLDVLLKQSS